MQMTGGKERVGSARHKLSTVPIDKADLRAKSPIWSSSSQSHTRRNPEHIRSLTPSSQGSVTCSKRPLLPLLSRKRSGRLSPFAQRGSNKRSPPGCVGSQTNGSQSSKQGYSKFKPHPGDIVIVQSDRRPTKARGLGGFVALYSDNELFNYTIVRNQHTLDAHYTQDFYKGDIIVRMGTFDKYWKWHPAKVVQVFVCENKHLWWPVAKLGWHPLERPLHSKHFERLHLVVPCVDYFLKPRFGDFIIRGLPGFENLDKWEALWWHLGLEMKPYDMLLRASYEASREFDNLNSTQVVVEMYWLYDTLQYWIFVGRDAFTYTAHKNSNLFFAYNAPITRSDLSINWQRMQDPLTRKHNRTFFRHQSFGKQKRVPDQPYDHHLLKPYDHLGFDDLELTDLIH